MAHFSHQNSICHSFLLLTFIFQVQHSFCSCWTFVLLGLSLFKVWHSFFKFNICVFEDRIRFSSSTLVLSMFDVHSLRLTLHSFHWRWTFVFQVQHSFYWSSSSTFVLLKRDEVRLTENERELWRNACEETACKSLLTSKPYVWSILKEIFVSRFTLLSEVLCSRNSGDEESFEPDFGDLCTCANLL